MREWEQTLGAGAFAFLLMDLLGCVYRYHEKEIVLEFGMLTGSDWGMANTGSFVIMGKAIVRLEEEHPGVKVHHYSRISKKGYSEWCVRKFLEGKIPDMFMVPDSDSNLYSSPGVLKNLNELIEYDAGFDRSDFLATALDAGKYEGHQCALPYEMAPVLLFVNRSLLVKEQTEVPGEDWTWDDMYGICRRITKNTNGGGLLGQFGTYNYSWRNTVYTSEGRLYDGDQQQLSFINSHVLDVIKYMRRLNDLSQGQSVTQEDFSKGNVVFMLLTLTEYRTYKTYPYGTEKYTKFQWGCIAFPMGKEGENHSRVDSLFMRINSGTKHEKLAWELLKQLTRNEEMQMDTFRYFQGVSVPKSVTGSARAAAIVQEDMDEGEQVINSNLLYNVIENGIIELKLQQYEQVMSLAGGEVSEILMGNKNVDSSIKILQRSITECLQQQG